MLLKVHIGVDLEPLDKDVQVLGESPPRSPEPKCKIQKRPAAASNVEKTLHKLQKEGKARPRELSPCPIRVPSFLPLAGARVDVFLLKRWSLLP